MTHVNCPKCGERLNLPPIQEKRGVRCPACKHEFAVSPPSQPQLLPGDYTGEGTGVFAKTSLAAVAALGIRWPLEDQVQSQSGKIMRVCIHRGSRQIGGSCVEVESQGQRLLIDLGLPLDADENKSQYLPNVSGLDGTDPTMLGVLISHPHLDHFGLIAHISPNIPVGMGPAARRILAAAAPFLPDDWPTPAKGWNYQSEQSFDIGPFRVTPFLLIESTLNTFKRPPENQPCFFDRCTDLTLNGANV